MKTITNLSNVVAFTPDSEENEGQSFFFYCDPETQFYGVCNQNDTYFLGHTTNDFTSGCFMGDTQNQLMTLAVRAINNRTRERNFARLSESLALNEITEEEYDAILDKNEDDYVIKCNVTPSVLDLKLASFLAPNLLDVEDVDDLSVLFSFDGTAVKRFLGK